MHCCRTTVESGASTIGNPHLSPVADRALAPYRPGENYTVSIPNYTGISRRKFVNAFSYASYENATLVRYNFHAVPGCFANDLPNPPENQNKTSTKQYKKVGGAPRQNPFVPFAALWKLFHRQNLPTPVQHGTLDRRGQPREEFGGSRKPQAECAGGARVKMRRFSISFDFDRAVPGTYEGAAHFVPFPPISRAPISTLHGSIVDLRSQN
jgi:hypothetical protein